MITPHPHDEASEISNQAQPFRSIVHDVWGLTSNSQSRRRSKRHASYLTVAGVVYSVLTCAFVAFLVASQFFGILASGINSIDRPFIGRDPALGLYDTGKTNDVPYSDRVIACVRRQSDSYVPVLVEDLVPPLGSSTASLLMDDSGRSIDAFRVIERTSAILDSSAFDVYSHTCTLASTTMPSVLDVCKRLGYNVTADRLRVIRGVDSNNTYVIENSLPLLLMPNWDNSHQARTAIPGRDGSACIVRLTGMYERPDVDVAIIRGINRSVREMKTEEWLQRSGGTWRNGWYEDLDGMKWYSDMMTSRAHGQLLPTSDREFVVSASSINERDCSHTKCGEEKLKYLWGPKFVVEMNIQDSRTIVIFNGTQFGIFVFEADVVLSVHSTYDWPMAVSNITIALLIFRWTVSLLAIYRGYATGSASLHYIGIGALSNATSFQYLPVLLLPRLASTLNIFFSLGCAFQDQQKALTDTWFVVYPAIIELVLIYYSLLNAVAKMLRRRISDVLFAPTIIALSGIHFFRVQILRSQWLNVSDGIILTLVSSDELKALSLDQFFTTDIALRLNGNIQRLFILKLIILAVSLVPLFLTRSLPVHRETSTSLRGIEKALAVRCANVAGLGQSSNPFELLNTPDAVTSIRLDAGISCVLPFDHVRALNSYEVIRLGCIVYGDKYLITMDDWDRVSMLAGFRHLYHLWNHRVVVFQLQESKVVRGKMEVSEYPCLMRVDDPELTKISFWQISGRSLLC